MPHRCLRTGPTTPHHQVSRPPGLYLVFSLNYPCHIYNLIYTFIALFFSQPSQTRGAFIKGLGVMEPLFLHAQNQEGILENMHSCLLKFVNICHLATCACQSLLYYRDFFFTEANARGDANQKPTHVRRYQRVTIHCVSLFTHGRFSIFQN